MGLDLVREVRGAMTHFNQLTPELVAVLAEDDLTYDQLASTMARYGLDIKKVVLDETRAFQDEIGIAAIQAEHGFTRKDKERAVRLYSIAKDMDALDRVRFNGLDYRLLRTPYARRLPLVAGGLLKEKLEEVIHQMDDESLGVILNGNG